MKSANIVHRLLLMNSASRYICFFILCDETCQRALDLLQVPAELSEQVRVGFFSDLGKLLSSCL